MTIIEFLLARLREQESIVLRATSAWPTKAEKVYDGVYSVALPDGAVDRDEPVIDDWDVRIRREEAEFIVHHSPARVLADIAAKREIMELHQPTPTSTVEVDGREVEQDSFEEIVSREVNCMACAGYPEAPCRTLRLLASVFADHPDYRDEWSI